MRPYFFSKGQVQTLNLGHLRAALSLLLLVGLLFLLIIINYLLLLLLLLSLKRVFHQVSKLLCTLFFFSTQFSVFGYSDEKRFLMFDISHETHFPVFDTLLEDPFFLFF